MTFGRIALSFVPIVGGVLAAYGGFNFGYNIGTLFNDHAINGKAWDSDSYAKLVDTAASGFLAALAQKVHLTVQDSWKESILHQLHGAL